MKTRVLLVLAATLLLASGMAVACTSSDTEELEERISSLETSVNEQLQAVSDATQRSAMISAVDILDSAGLHAIDEAANEEGTVEAGASGPVARALLAVAATAWPGDLQAQADEVAASLRELADALESADPEEVGPPAAAAHDVQHEFSETVRNMIAEEAGLPVKEHE